ncbi:hypothetical protein ACFPTR_09650 [Aliibacillus thermotolerans]|uniref:DUF4064 domain-containing protein n=1 Tax=Aliibacillus thermotolerans TaxID=1834418 RepID=A0ABW0U8Z7_9BACI|nr:hypothetical protein [Aliibacillus thermotolerans]MDA3129615.1 hypothetical protein [Aliibacillus thermotolerans]
MNIAIGIIAIIISFIVGIQSFTVSVLSEVVGEEATAGAGAIGVLVAFLYLVGGAFAFKLTNVAKWILGIGGLLGLLAGATSDYSDVTVWGILGLIMSGLLFWDVKRKNKQKDKEKIA